MGADTTPPGLLSALRQAISDPRSVLARREHDEEGNRLRELLSHWQFRAAAQAVAPFLAKPPELSEPERCQIEEARTELALFDATRHLTGASDSPHTQPLRNLLALLDKIAPKEQP